MTMYLQTLIFFSRKILDFWLPLFLPLFLLIIVVFFLACKHKKLLFQKWGYYTGFEVHFSFFFFLQPWYQIHNMKLLKDQKSDKAIFQQCKYSIYIRNYSYHTFETTWGVNLQIDCFHGCCFCGKMEWFQSHRKN